MEKVDIAYYRDVADVVNDSECLKSELINICDELKKERAHYDLIAKAIKLLDEGLSNFMDLDFTHDNILKWAGELYTYAHSVNVNTTCYEHHQDWRDKIIVDYNKSKEPT